ncbi:MULTISPECIES: hypothetical protein [Streptomyces]|uniref:hypothetical protein n=1 Tax=Streptomyces TaxID=1883 RepID=UPI000B9E7FAE|nr:hypothetical protein [Streptomyces kasugaensis]
MKDQQDLKALMRAANLSESNTLRPESREITQEISWGVMHLGSLMAVCAVSTLLACHAWETSGGAFAIVALTSMSMSSFCGYLRTR